MLTGLGIKIKSSNQHTLQYFIVCRYSNGNLKLYFEELPPPDVSFLGSAENFFLTFRHLQRLEITCQSALGVAMEPKALQIGSRP